MGLFFRTDILGKFSADSLAVLSTLGDKPMRQKVFISWSGEQSKTLAEAFRAWIPRVLQNVEPWLSSSDILAGTRWNSEIARQLEVTRFGIICITSENAYRPWLLFEAGAIGKTLKATYVCPYLLDIDCSRLPAPLAQFQAVQADRDGTFGLLRSLNESLGEDCLASDVLEETFETWWPRLNDILIGARRVAKREEESKFQLITDRTKRTQVIVEDMKKLKESLHKEHATEHVRFSGALSALAIGDEELRDKTDAQYAGELLDERDCLLQLVRDGCLLRCIITPPYEYDVFQRTVPRGLRRLECLLAFLTSADPAHENIEWAVSPFRQPNIYIIGHKSYFEGFKKSPESGYDLTLRQSSEEAVAVNTSMYDALFDYFATYTLIKYSKEAAHDRRDALRLATVACLEEARRTCLKHERNRSRRSRS